MRASRPMRATSVLKQDHALIKSLFWDFARTTANATKTRYRLAVRLVAHLEVHAQIEDEIFYPAMDRVRSARSLLQEARGEHAEVKAMVAVVADAAPDDRVLTTLVADLSRAVLHHAIEEEKVLLPLAEIALGRDRLLELGDRLRSRSRQLMLAQRPVRVSRRSGRPAA